MARKFSCQICNGFSIFRCVLKVCLMNAGDFALFDLTIQRRGRGWRWSVIDGSGTPLLTGTECSRTAAHYKATRAIFQMLLIAPYRVRISPAAWSLALKIEAPRTSLDPGRRRGLRSRG